MNNKQMPEEFLDQFFDEIINGTQDSVSARDFSQRMSSTIRQKGFDSLNKVIDEATKQKDNFSNIAAPPMVKDGYTFVQNEMALYRYDTRHQGLYKDGHQQAFKNYLDQFNQNPKMIQTFRSMIKHDIRQRQRSSSSNDRYTEGYIDGLKELVSFIKRAQTYMMDKVRMDLEKKGSYGSTSKH